MMKITVLTTSDEPHGFIREHARRISAELFALHGPEPGRHEPSGERPYPITVGGPSIPPKTILTAMKHRLLGVRFSSLPKASEMAWKEYLIQRRPDVVLAEFAPEALAGLPACVEHGIPLITHFHGYDASSLLRFRDYRRQLPYLFKHSAAVVAVSTDMRQRLAQCGCPMEKIHVIPCGADVDRFRPSQAVRENLCRFVFVARLIRQKGIMETLEAFRVCQRGIPDVSLRVVGDGPLRHKAERWVQKNGLGESVSFMGSVPHEEVARILSESSVLVQHSHKVPPANSIEGWGISLAEGSASGLPVVATRHGGITDVVVDGRTGFLVPEGDWRAMGERMIELAENPHLRRHMGMAGREHILEVGNLVVQVQKLTAILQSAAASKMYASARPT